MLRSLQECVQKFFCRLIKQRLLTGSVEILFFISKSFYFLLDCFKKITFINVFSKIKKGDEDKNLTGHPHVGN